jgi:hypothetical protein
VAADRVGWSFRELNANCGDPRYRGTSRGHADRQGFQSHHDLNILIYERTYV